MSDRPRKIVVCHPDDYAAVNAAVMALHYGDVLVKRDSFVDAGKVIVMDDPFKPIIGLPSGPRIGGVPPWQGGRLLKRHAPPDPATWFADLLVSGASLQINDGAR